LPARVVPDREIHYLFPVTMDKMNTDTLIILVKNPTAVNERPPALRVFSDEQMLELKTAFIEDTICTCARLDGVDLKVAVAPEERAQLASNAMDNLIKRFPRRQAFTTLPERSEILTQKVAPLAERMSETVDHCFTVGYERVLVLGGYNPTITRMILNRALRELKHQQVVLGPTIRGGFYLIGTDAHRPELFGNIPVGTDDAYRAVCDRLGKLDLAWKELDLWYDVSHQEDIEFIVRDINQFRLTGDEESARATEEVLTKYLDQEREQTA